MTPLRLPAEGEPCECEQEAAEIVVTVEGMAHRMVKLPMEAVDVDEMAMLDGKSVTRACGFSEGNKRGCKKWLT